MAWGVEAEMPSVGNEVSETALSWLVIREDDSSNRYLVGRYATREEAQRISDRLASRGHTQLYLVERLSGQERSLNINSFHEFKQGFGRSQLEQIPEETPPPSKAPVAADDEPTDGLQEVADRRLRRGRPLFEALAHILPADARERWAEEWTAEWVDLGERPLRTRVAFLMWVTLRSLPSIAWTLRLAARRQSAR